MTSFTKYGYEYGINDNNVVSVKVHDQNDGKRHSYVWLGENIINGEVEDILKGKPDFGLICMPTGYGKSSAQYINMMDTVVYITAAVTAIAPNLLDVNESRKRIINLSSPYLKLNRQFIYDLWEVFTIVLGYYEYTQNKKILRHIKPIINSSDTTDYHELMPGGRTPMYLKNWSPADVTADYADDAIQVILMTSCHDSLHNVQTRNFGGWLLDNYIDESHLVAIRKDDASSEGSKTRVDLNKLCEKSNKLYLFSATPDKDSAKIVNKYNGYAKLVDKLYTPIYAVSAYEAIKEGRIVEPHAEYVSTKNGYLTADCVWMSYYRYKHDPDYEKYPVTKVLVNCCSYNHVKMLADELHRLSDGSNIPIYAIDSSSEGARRIEPNGKVIRYNKSESNKFITDIDSERRDCIILHIHILTAGMDISTLTHTIIYTKDICSSKAHIVQTVGRTVRLGKFVLSDGTVINDRDEKDFSKRLKKTSMVTFVVPEDYAANGSAEKDIKDLWMGYYGIGDPFLTKKRYNDGTPNSPKPPVDDDNEQEEDPINESNNPVRIEFSLADIICKDKSTAQMYLTIARSNNEDLIGKTQDYVLREMKGIKSDSPNFYEFENNALWDRKSFVEIVKKLATDKLEEYSRETTNMDKSTNAANA